MGGASVVLGGSHQILDGHVFGLGMSNYTIKKSYTIRFPTMNSEKTLQAKKKKQYIYIYIIYIYIICFFLDCSVFSLNMVANRMVYDFFMV